jgi:YegS/Rv2252/BmrU family lipid kinase
VSSLSSPRAFTAVVNPAAGGGAEARLGPVADLLRAAGCKVALEYSESLEHAGTLARTASERGDVVIAAGGDGTVGALAAAVAEAQGVLGIVPAGRGNDFARQLGIPSEPERVAAVLRDAEPVAVDLAEAAGRLVAGSVYTGVDAVANAYTNRSRLPAGLAYYVGPLRAVMGWRSAAYRITVDGEVIDHSGFTVVVANSGYYGNGLHIAPAAAVDDGALDVVVIKDCPKRSFFSVMRELPKGEHVRRPIIATMRATEVRVEADRELPFGADGEIIGTLPVTVRIRPAVLRTLCVTSS